MSGTDDLKDCQENVNRSMNDIYENAAGGSPLRYTGLGPYRKPLPRIATAEMISAGIGWREKDPREETGSDKEADMVDRIYRSIWDASPEEPSSQRNLDCDEVSQILSAIREHTFGPNRFTSSSRAIPHHSEMGCLALLYEIMDIARLGFEDAAAVHNATPRAVRPKLREDLPVQGMIGTHFDTKTEDEL